MMINITHQVIDCFPFLLGITPIIVLAKDFLQSIFVSNCANIQLRTVIVRIIQSCSDEKFTVELVGLCTDICVVSNALMLKANFPEMDMFVDSTCCAGVTVESHEAALTTMKMCQIGVK